MMCTYDFQWHDIFIKIPILSGSHILGPQGPIISFSLITSPLKKNSGFTNQPTHFGYHFLGDRRYRNFENQYPFAENTFILSLSVFWVRGYFLFSNWVTKSFILLRTTILLASSSHGRNFAFEFGNGRICGRWSFCRSALFLKLLPQICRTNFRVFLKHWYQCRKVWKLNYVILSNCCVFAFLLLYKKSWNKRSGFRFWW